MYSPRIARTSIFIAKNYVLYIEGTLIHTGDRLCCFNSHPFLRPVRGKEKGFKGDLVTKINVKYVCYAIPVIQTKSLLLIMDLE